MKCGWEKLNGNFLISANVFFEFSFSKIQKYQDLLVNDYIWLIYKELYNWKSHSNIE